MFLIFYVFAYFTKDPGVLLAVAFLTAVVIICTIKILNAIERISPPRAEKPMKNSKHF